MRTMGQKNRQSKKIYHYILFSILASLSVSVIISTFFITNRYQNIYLENIKQSENDRLIQASSTSNFMTEYGMNLALQIYFNPSFSKVLFFEEYKMENIRDAIAQLNHIRLSTSFIESIYLYNHLNQEYIVSSSKSSNTIQSREVFEDPFIDSIINNTGYYEENSIYNGKALFIPRKTNPNKEDPIEVKTVYSLVYKNAFTNPELSSVVINISSQWFEDILFKNINRNEDRGLTDIFAVDSRDRVVINNRHYSIMQDLGEVEWFSLIKESNLLSGYLIAEIDHEPMLINYYKSHNLQIDWMFVSIKSYSSIIKEINDLRKNTLIISLLLLLVSILIEATISNRLYQPIRKLLNTLETSQEGRDDYRITLKNNFFRIYLQQKVPLKKEDLTEEFSKFQINLNREQNYMMILLRIDNYHDISDDISLKSLSLLKYQILKEFSDALFGEDSMYEIIVLHGKFMLIICNLFDGKPEIEEFKTQMIDLFNQKRQTIAEDYGVKYSAFTSEPDFGLEKIPPLYGELMNAAKKTRYFDKSMFLSLTDFYNQEKAKFDYPARDVAKIIENLKKGEEFSQIKEEFDGILNKAINHSHKAFNYCITGLLLETNDLIYSLTTYNEFQNEFEIGEMLDDLEYLENYEILIEKFYLIFKEIINHQSRVNNKNEELIKRVQSIVGENYSNSLFSITNIADQLNLTSAYLGKLYKKSTLQSLNDYITQVRLDKSMELLRDSDTTINEIALSTGFSTANYYHIVFKKKMGMTPQKYRNSRL